MLSHRGVKEGETKVDVAQYFKEILPGQYSIVPQLASPIELMANSFDAGASKIEIIFDPREGILEILDNGNGMGSRDFVDYHDIRSTKRKGSNIGWVGQGAKLALLFCDRVETETWADGYKAWSEWHLDKGAWRAPYRIHDNETKTLRQKGTRVKLYLDKISKNFYSERLIIDTIYEHYYPLIEPSFFSICSVYRVKYPHGVQIFINKKLVPSFDILGRMTQKEVIQLRRRGGGVNTWGFFGLQKEPINNFLPGIMISCWGKVIERTFFKKKLKDEERIVGWIEAPYLLACVRTDKCGFIQDKMWQGFFLKAQSQFQEWLEKTGLLQRLEKISDVFEELERELTSILKHFPDLPIFALPFSRDVAIPDEEGEKMGLGNGTQITKGTEGGEGKGGGIKVTPGPESGKAPTIENGNQTPAKVYPRVIRGPNIRLLPDDRPDLEEEAWFDGTTASINIAHPAFKRARKEGDACLRYHQFKAAFLAIIKHVVESKEDASYRDVFDLQQKFFAIWGQQG